MSLDDQRYVETLYGFYPNEWENTWGIISNEHHMLDREYIDLGCETTDYSIATATNKFLYPFYTKKTYFIEGVIKGQITLGSSGATSTVTAYRVSLCKTHQDTTDEEIISTGWITVNDSLAWDAILSVGDEEVYPFWIDCWQEIEIIDKERLYLKVEVNADNHCILYHANGGNTIDLKIEIPMRG